MSDTTDSRENLTAHQCDDGCNVSYCQECGPDYTNPCKGHRAYGHVRSFDPYGDGVDCHACCPICGTGVLSPAPEEATEPRQVVVTLVFSVFTNETDDEFAERFLCEVECLPGVVTMPNGSLVLP